VLRGPPFCRYHPPAQPESASDGAVGRPPGCFHKTAERAFEKGNLGGALAMAVAEAAKAAGGKKGGASTFTWIRGSVAKM